MVLRSSLFLVLIFFLTWCDSVHAYFGSRDGSEPKETLGRLRRYFDGNPSQFQPHLFKSFRSRETKPFPSYSVDDRDTSGRVRSPPYVVEPDESEIDEIGNEMRHSEVQIPPQAVSQPETVPDVVQKLPDNAQKVSRAPLRQPDDSPFAQEARRASDKPSDIYFIALVAGCSGAAVFGVITAGFCWYKLQKNAKAAAAADYPAYGVTGPSKESDMTSPPSGDRRLAQNAQMFHYQHQKQQMIAIEKANSDRHVSTSDLDSEEENEEGDYTVYECPGLAPTGEMEVKNPLFQDDSNSASPPSSAKDSEKPSTK